MPWMCLENCGEDINTDLQQIVTNANLLTAVSFECYDLGTQGALVFANFTSVYKQIQGLGLKAFPMITTANMDKLRQLWPVQNQFIQAAVKEAVLYGYDGFNVDFEPETSDVTSDDAQNYANFLTAFATALHNAGPFTLSCDAASWTPFFNWGLIAASGVDKIMTMDTYDSNFTFFQTQLLNESSVVGMDKLCVGLESENPNTGNPFTLDEMTQRFDLIKQVGAKEIDIWMTPIPDLWWDLIADFLGKNSN